MADQPIRLVNVVPNIKIKKEIIEDDDEECVSCQICSKSFYSEMALRNHARMEHVSAYVSGEVDSWVSTQKEKVKVEPGTTPDKAAHKKMIKVKTEELISSMVPTDLMTLTSKDVSYIIIKTEPDVNQRKRKRDAKKETEKVKKDKVVTEKVKDIMQAITKQGKREKKEKNAVVREHREPQSIVGPFECLQPSTLVADGTCHQIFFSCCEYSVHFRDEHTRRRKGLRCQVCEKPLSGEAGDVAPYPCEVCGAGFQASRDLSDHMSSDHVKLKPFQCTVCYKRFTQQGGLQQHMRMHTGDRPFQCTFCPKAFTQKSGRDQHMRIHTKVKPYRCVVCSKAFCQSVHLKQHMRTHTNVAPFQCGICSKRFKQSSHLNYHLKNHNPGNLSEDQRKQYKSLIHLINGGNSYYVSDNVEVQVTEGEAGTTEEGQGGEVEETEVVEEEVELDEEMVQEQMLAEQSIQVEGHYVTQEDGEQEWRVQLVENEEIDEDRGEGEEGAVEEEGEVGEEGEEGEVGQEGEVGDEEEVGDDEEVEEIGEEE